MLPNIIKCDIETQKTAEMNGAYNPVPPTSASHGLKRWKMDAKKLENRRRKPKKYMNNRNFFIFTLKTYNWYCNIAEIYSSLGYFILKKLAYCCFLLSQDDFYLMQEDLSSCSKRTFLLTARKKSPCYEKINFHAASSFVQQEDLSSCHKRILLWQIYQILQRFENRSRNFAKVSVF